MTAPDPAPTPLADRLREALVDEVCVQARGFGYRDNYARRIAEENVADAFPALIRALDRAGLVLAEREERES